MMEEKQSVSRVRKSSGSFTFRIEGFSGLNNRIGDSTESPEFELVGYTWQVSFQRSFPFSTSNMTFQIFAISA